MSFKKINPENIENIRGMIFINDEILIKDNELKNLTWKDFLIPLKIPGTEGCILLIEEDKSPYNGEQVIFGQWKNINLPEGYRLEKLKFFLPVSQNLIIKNLSRYKSILNWINTNKFCGCCGSSNRFSDKEEALVCSNIECGRIIYPRISPAIITLIHKGSKILLAKHNLRNQEIYTCIAGYVEAGETVEECVHREVYEEVGLKIKDLTYAGSQYWPFPDQIMFAFHCNWAEGEINPDPVELKEAKWFETGNLPENIPVPGSVAYNLIKGKFSNKAPDSLHG